MDTRWKKGQRGGPGRKAVNVSASAYEALRRARCEPITKIIRMAETCADFDKKLAIWKYLAEMREASIEKNIAIAARPSEDPQLLKQLEAPLPSPVDPKSQTPTITNPAG